MINCFGISECILSDLPAASINTADLMIFPFFHPSVSSEKEAFKQKTSDTHDHTG